MKGIIIDLLYLLFLLAGTVFNFVIKLIKTDPTIKKCKKCGSNRINKIRGSNHETCMVCSTHYVEKSGS